MPFPAIEAAAGILLRVVVKSEQECHGVIGFGALDDLLHVLAGTDLAQTDGQTGNPRTAADDRLVPGDR